MSMWTDLSGLAFRQWFCEADGARTRIIEAGQGAPLILLHGSGGHAEAFMRNIAEHARHFRVIAMDMLGHGHTAAPKEDCTLQTLVDHLHAVIEALQLDRVAIAGVSLGGMVACWYAIQHPERVRALTLVTGMLMSRDDKGKRELQDALDRTQKAVGAPSREAVRNRLAWLMHEPDKSITEELVDVRYAFYSDPERGRVTGKITGMVVRGLLDDAWVDRWSHERHLEGIRCPTLLVWTRHNPGLDAERAAVGMQRIRDARMEIFDHSGHWPQWEEADRFNAVNIAFLLDSAAR